MRISFISSITAAAIALSAAPAIACPACFAASSPGTLRAFYLSTVLLTTMPFLIIAGFVILLRHTPPGRPPAGRPRAPRSEDGGADAGQ